MKVRTLSLLTVVAMLATTLMAVGGATPAGAQVIGIFDGDFDGFYDEIELQLGSDPGDPLSTPEHIALPLSCMDQIDNDLDVQVDLDDPGCEPQPFFTDAFPGAGRDIFSSTLTLDAYPFDTVALGVCDLSVELEGPVVVDRSGADAGGTVQTEIVAMQLSGDATLLPGAGCGLPAPFQAHVTLLEDPSQVSGGLITPQDPSAGDFPADSFFDVWFLVDVPGIGVIPGGPPGGPPGPVQVDNVIRSIPPYHGEGPDALNPDCYDFGGPHEHCPKPPLDHFKCYSGRFTPFDPRVVQIRDQFVTATVDVVRPLRFCNVVSKNGEPIFDENAHLKFYKVEPPISRAGVRVDVLNQFGFQRLRLGRLESLVLPTTKDGHGAPLALDHFACWRVVGKKVRERVTLWDQFENRRAWVLDPRLLCNPADKTDEAGVTTPAADPAWHLVCYLLKAPRPKVRDVGMSNQFGDEVLRVKRVDLLCVPSAKFLLGREILR